MRRWNWTAAVGENRRNDSWEVFFDKWTPVQGMQDEEEQELLHELLSFGFGRMMDGMVRDDDDSSDQVRGMEEVHEGNDDEMERKSMDDQAGTRISEIHQEQRNFESKKTRDMEMAKEMTRSGMWMETNLIQLSQSR